MHFMISGAKFTHTVSTEFPFAYRVSQLSVTRSTCQRVESKSESESAPEGGRIVGFLGNQSY